MNKIDINMGGQVIKKVSLKLDLKEYSKKIILNIIEQINYKFIFNIL